MDDSSRLSNTLQNTSQRWFTLILDYSEHMLDMEHNVFFYYTFQINIIYLLFVR